MPRTIQIKSYQFAGGVSFLCGLSLLFEHYLATAPTLAATFYLLRWFPLGGQFALGLGMAIGGALCFTPVAVVRLVALSLGALTWGILGANGLYVSLLGPSAKDVGALLGIMSVAMVFCCITACSRLSTDLPSRTARVRS